MGKSILGPPPNVQESVHGKDPITSTYGHNCAKDAITEFSKNTIILNRTCQKNTFSVTVGDGIGDFTYQIILQSIFMTNKC